MVKDLLYYLTKQLGRRALALFSQKRRARRTVPKKNSLRYSESTKPQEYGQGSTNLRITFDDVVGSNSRLFNLSEVLGAASEMLESGMRYRFGKITRIGVTIRGNNLTNYQYPTYIRMLWTDDLTTDIEKDDSTKIVAPFNNRTRTFTFIPPNASLPVTSVNTSLKQYNYKEWVVLDDIFDYTVSKYMFPGVIQVNPATDDLMIRIEALCEFRGKKPLVTEQVSRLIDALKKEKEKRDENKSKTQSAIGGLLKPKGLSCSNNEDNQVPNCIEHTNSLVF